MAFKKVNKAALALRLVAENPATYSVAQLAQICNCSMANIRHYISDGSLKPTVKVKAPRMNRHGIQMVDVTLVSLSKKGWGRVNNSAGKSSAPWSYTAKAVTVSTKKGKM